MGFGVNSLRYPPRPTEDIKLMCKGLHVWLQDWYEARKKKYEKDEPKYIASSEIEDAVRGFFLDHLDYVRFRHQFKVVWDFIEGTYISANPCCGDACCYPLDRVKVRGIKDVVPVDWNDWSYCKKLVDYIPDSWEEDCK